MSIVLSIKYPDSSESIEISEGVFTLGRSRATDIKLKDDKVSGKHIAIELRDNKLTLKDIGSTNGSFLNGNKIDNRVVEFTLDDEIQIGQTYIRIDKTSLNSAERKLLSKNKDVNQVKFIEPISADELASNDEDKDSHQKNEAPEKETPPLTEINFSIDLDKEVDAHTELRVSSDSVDPEETLKVRKSFKQVESNSNSRAGIHTRPEAPISDETRTNYVLDAEDIKSADIESLELEKQKQGQVIKKRPPKKNTKKEEKAKKGFFSKLFK